MDILYLVDRLENLIASSRKMPLMNQILVKENEILTLVEQMRATIPDEVKQAKRIVQEKERVLAQAQSEAAAILARAREESERAIHREGLLRAAEERSQELIRQANERAHALLQQAEDQCDTLKSESDSYVAETLMNLRDHLTSIEGEVSRTILSIERGLDSLHYQQELPEEDARGLEEQYMEEEFEDEPPVRRAPRRASLARDTLGGPSISEPF